MSVVDTGSARVRVTKRMYLTEDRERAVPEGDPSGRFLLCVPGSEMLRADALRYGVLEPEPAPEPTPEPEPAPEEKKAPPPANKSRRPASNKGV